MKTYQCGCGTWGGELCAWQGPASQMVVVEWMPESIRASHEAAGNSGCWPHNGSVRVAVEAGCADMLIEADPEWSTIIDAPVVEYAAQIALKRDVTHWEPAATFVATFSDGHGERACDVEVRIGEDEGVWFCRTADDAGGDDDCDDTQYATQAEARAAAVAYAEDHDEGDGHSAADYLTKQRAEIAELGEDPEGEFALYWETVLEDAGERKRYSTYEAACAAADLAQGKFDASNPRGGGVTYLCGCGVRRLVDGEWMTCDEDGEVRD